MDKNQKQVWKTFFLISQISITMLTTIFICIGMGFLVRRFFHINIMWLFIVIGVLAGFNSVVILVRRFISEDLESCAGKQYTPDKEVLDMIRNKKNHESGSGKN